ncbi:hypothetical protein IW262DRAFT_1043253 [Armillaria fumosa]|nr:hypothetical protein IW262DRAFT_1043253 [Armillaria fumosa]
MCCLRKTCSSLPAYFGTREITSLYGGTENHTDTKNPRSHLNQLVDLINHDYMPSLLYDAMPPSIGSSPSFFQEQFIERLPSVRYHPYSGAHTSQKTSHTLSISEANTEGALSSETSSSRSSDDDLASVASSFVSVSSEFSVDVLPCPEGFHRAEFDPRHQEILAQNLNLPVDKVFYYESMQDETTHKCPLGCGTEFLGYTIRQHMKKFHKGMSNGPQVQCDRSLLPEGSNIQCSGKKMSAQSFAHHFEDVHCHRSALCPYCLVLQTRRCSLPRHFQRCSALHPKRTTRRAQPVVRRSAPRTSSEKRR